MKMKIANSFKHIYRSLVRIGWSNENIIASKL